MVGWCVVQAVLGIRIRFTPRVVTPKVYLKGGGVWIQNCLRTDIFVKITRNEWKKLNAISSTQYKCTITILFSEYHLTVICLQYLSKIIIFFLLFLCSFLCNQ